jgi:hypothetical protein
MALQLKLTDRSRYETGLSHCPRERWLGTAWTNGYGIRKKATGLALATGTTYHDGLRPILEFARAQGHAPPPSELPRLVQPALDAFRQKALSRNIDLGVPEDRAAHIAEEQIALSAGLCYAWTQRVLPWIVQMGRILDIEREDVIVVGCTCGLGDLVGTAEQHDARECGGIGWQTRPDFIHEDLGGSLVYHDFKGTGWLNDGWKNSWPYKIQVMAGALGAEQRYGKPITQVMIHGLYKGRRAGAYNPETKKYDGEKMQQSDLCYAYYAEPNPPLIEGGWRLERPTGKGATQWKKRGIWEYPGGMWRWFEQLPPENLDACLVLVGPFSVKRSRVEGFLRQMVEQEKGWAEIEYQLYSRLVEVNGDWTAPAYRELLDRLVPQSNDCYRFGHPCQMLAICDEEPGWEQPLEIGYELRRPHHEPEMAQMTARGLEPPPDEQDVDNEGE